MPAGSLNVALWVDDLNIPEWQFQMVQQIITTRRVHLRLVIVDTGAPKQTVQATTSEARLKRWISTLRNDVPALILDYGWYVLRSIDRLWSGESPNPLQRRSLHALCRPEIRYALADKQLPVQYAKHSIDVLLQVGHGKEPPEWLCRASRHGVWRLFASDVSRCCDVLAGIQEYVDGACLLYTSPSPRDS